MTMTIRLVTLLLCGCASFSWCGGGQGDALEEPGRDIGYVAIDLGAQANQLLDETFPPGHYPGDTLKELPKGRQVLGGIPFEVGDRMVQLRGKFLPEHPESINGIKVARRVDKLHLLHAARWGAFGRRGDSFGHWIADGVPIAYYEIVYEDGTSAAMPVIYGEDVRDFWNIWDESKPTVRSEVVWQGNNDHLRGRPEARNHPTPLRLYHSTWTNPHPEKPVASVNVVSLNQAATLFCVALTAETSATREDRLSRLEAEVEDLRRQIEELRRQIDSEN
jgi:hypothetical protein